jgi:hypothetical protein
MFFNIVNLFKGKKFRIFPIIDFIKVNIAHLDSPIFKVGLFGIKFEFKKKNKFTNKVINNLFKIEINKNGDKNKYFEL